MTVIAVVNESADVTDQQARLMTKACHLQIQKHVAPLWYLEPWAVRFYTKEKYVPKDSLEIVILENEKNAAALGYHHETPKGRRYGCVFTKSVLEDGGSVFQSDYSVSAVLSHEVIEAFIDPDINLWAEGKSGEMWAYEACDPVQEDAYRIRANGTLVYVSNFVLPTWFATCSESCRKICRCPSRRSKFRHLRGRAARSRSTPCVHCRPSGPARSSTRHRA